MKKSLLLTTLLTFCLSSLQVPAADLKIAVVDMQEVFKQYYKTKDAETRIKEVGASFNKDLQDMMGEYQKSVDEAKKLKDDSQNSTLDQKVRDEKTKAFQVKLQDLQNKERQINEFRSTRGKQIDDQAGRMRKAIVDEINVAVKNLGSTGKYNLILDKSGMTLNGTPAALYVDGVTDLTNDIINTMNASAPKGSTTSTPSALLSPAAPSASTASAAPAPAAPATTTKSAAH